MTISKRSQRYSERLQAARGMRRNPTPAEAKLWNRLKGRRLDGLKFRRQVPLSGWIVDFYCAASGVIVEIDDVGRDAARDATLQSQGFKVLRFPSHTIEHSIDDVLSAILRLCS